MAGRARRAGQEETLFRKIPKHDETRRLLVRTSLLQIVSVSIEYDEYEYEAIFQRHVKSSGVQGRIQRLKGGGEKRGGRG